MRKIAGVHGFGDVAATQRDAHQDLGLFHDALAIGLLVIRVAPAPGGHQHVAQPEVNARHVEIVNAGIADRGENAPKVGIRGKECRLDQRRVRDRVGDLQGLFDGSGLLDADGHELGCTFGVAHDLLGEIGGGRRQR